MGESSQSDDVPGYVLFAYLYMFFWGMNQGFCSVPKCSQRIMCGGINHKYSMKIRKLMSFQNIKN